MSSLMSVLQQILRLCDCSSTFSSCIYVCVCFCLLTTCCTGMGCGAMGAGLHCVVDMVLFCQFWPPVSFFSPGWLQCISGLKENHRHQMCSLMVLFAAVTFLLVEPEANFSNNNETLNWKGDNVMGFVFSERCIIHFKSRKKNNDMRHFVTNLSIKSNWVLSNSFYFDFSSCRIADWQKLCMFVTQRYGHLLFGGGPTKLQICWPQKETEFKSKLKRNWIKANIGRPEVFKCIHLDVMS